MAIRLVIAGMAGRMGQRILDLAGKDPAFQVVYGLEAPGFTAGPSAVPMGSDKQRIRSADVVIDFTSPESSVALAAAIAGFGKPLVIGTTGLTPEQDKQVAAAAKSIAIVHSPNMSRGVNVLFKIAQEVARALPSYAVEVAEAHHIHKKDKPSGTALRIGKVMEEAGGMKPAYQSIREGEIVGDHRVICTGPGERLELFHHAESRDTFAAGALQAAQWVVRQKPGIYSMTDVLGL